VGLDQEPFLLLVLNLCLDIVDLGLHIVNDVGPSCRFRGDNLAVKGVLIRALVTSTSGKHFSIF
jgi:hypothetical protein